jgi:hypothetical protein
MGDSLANLVAVSDADICDTLWERIGKKSLAELPSCLGFNPELNFVSDTIVTFVDSGVEVKLWLNKDQHVAMVNVKRVEG